MRNEDSIVVCVSAWLFGAFCAVFGMFIVYTMLVWTPVNLYTEAKCLRLGYPRHAVSIGLEQYCMNLDGSVTVKVDRQ